MDEVRQARVGFFSLKEGLLHCFLLLIISILSYGFFINKLGYFWDDWGLIYTQYFYGSKGFWNYITDRPFSNYYYAFIIKFIGIKPLLWHIYIIFTRWISGCLFYVFLRKTLPRFKSMAICASLVYIVFPGFSGNSMAWIYEFTYIVISFLLLSLILMRAYIVRKSGGWYLLVLALVFEAVHLMATEYFVGVEIARVFIIYVILYCIQAQGTKIIRVDLLKKAFRFNLPYLGVLGAYIIYRAFFFHQTTLGETNQSLIVHKIISNPVHNIVERIQNFVNDFFSLTVFLWTKSISGDNFTVGAKIVFILILCLIFIFYRKKIKDEDSGNISVSISKKQLSLLLIILGLVLIVLGNIPVIVIRKTVVLGAYGIGDRYSLPSMLGCCIFITGVFHYFISNSKYLLYAFSILTAGGGMYQFSMSKVFKEENDSLRNFYRELSWRIPAVEKGTYFMMSTNPEINHTSAGYSYAFAINGIYGKRDQANELHYWFSDIASNKGREPISIQPNVPLETKFRSYHFNGNTSKSITLFYPEKGCLRVVDSTNEKWIDSDPSTRVAASLSNTSLVKDTPEHKSDFLDQVFGHENKKCWCYYFEKIELAAQLHNWGKALSYINEARDKKLKPDNDVEWVICIEVAFRNSDNKLAEEIVTNELETKLAKGYAYQFISNSLGISNQFKNQLINILKESKPENETSNLN